MELSGDGLPPRGRLSRRRMAPCARRARFVKILPRGACRAAGPGRSTRKQSVRTASPEGPRHARCGPGAVRVVPVSASAGVAQTGACFLFGEDFG